VNRGKPRLEKLGHDVPKTTARKGGGKGVFFPVEFEERAREWVLGAPGGGGSWEKGGGREKQRTRRKMEAGGFNQSRVEREALFNNKKLPQWKRKNAGGLGKEVKGTLNDQEA